MPYQLVAVSGPSKGNAWEMGPHGLSMGRNASNDVVLADPTASRYHCRILLTNAKLSFQDLGSRNPALINGLPTAKQDLYAGDEIAIGAEVYLVAQPAPDAPVPAASGAEPDTVSRDHGEPLSIDAQSTRPGAGVLPRTVQDMAFLHESTRRFGACASRSELFATLRDRVTHRFAPEYLWLVGPVGPGSLEGDGDGEQPLPDKTVRLIRQAVQEGRGFLDRVNNLRKEPRKDAATLVSPIMYAGAPLGAVAVGTTSPHGVYDKEDLRLLVLLAQAAAPFVKAADQVNDLKLDNAWLRCLAGESTELLGTSRAMQRIRALTRKAAQSGLHVLILGETGRGKELVARMIREHSPQAQAPFVVVNCAAVPEHLLESELFGHEQGAFTGATRRHTGRIEQANGGIVFLDEVGDLSTPHQGRLLRTIEEGTFHRVGGEDTIHVQVRFVAATNRNLKAAIAAETFRGDLYHRLSGFQIELPPLREHPSDIPLLAEHFFQLAKSCAKRSFIGIHPDALERLCRHPWPGNVRELRNCIERAMAIAQDGMIGLNDIERAILASPADDWEAAQSLAEAEHRHIAHVLQLCGGNIRETARILDISRTTLYKKVEGYGIKTRAGQREP